MRERLWLLLMRALEDAGRRAEALEAYAQAQEVIAAELGVDPGAELQRFYARAARRRRVAAAGRAAAAAPDAARAAGRAGKRRRRREPAAAARRRRRLGGRRGRGGRCAGRRPEATPGRRGPTARQHRDRHLRRACPADRPPGAGRSAAATAARAGLPRPAQLPADIGDFTGRETHVEHLCALLPGEQRGEQPGRGPHRGRERRGGPRQDHARRARRAPGHAPEFPDGQLYVDLLGASAQPAAPGRGAGPVPARPRRRGRQGPGAATRSGRRCTGRRSPAAGC